MGIEDIGNTFICEICGEEVATIYMGRYRDVCEFCEAKGDDKDGRDLE